MSTSDREPVRVPAEAGGVSVRELLAACAAARVVSTPPRDPAPAPRAPAPGERQHREAA
ncbi:hypothetical protein [Streptomyces ureilyticus]|jgi:hypothetical protein|uniref:Uncharacterized protein n=1 Tax=Streptomyces ureilyticus TaxID=1775131 RepID=A0ABX0DGI1_9ACTN|nr:hypothetical protein [Streptomyces ureilyticus]NGO40976.1 hypothetical protein [Streptomyces ureilyticus]